MQENIEGLVEFILKHFGMSRREAVVPRPKDTRREHNQIVAKETYMKSGLQVRSLTERGVPAEKSEVSLTSFALGSGSLAYLCFGADP